LKTETFPEPTRRKIDVVEFLDLAHAIGLNPGRFIGDFDRIQGK
jgi:hypothetical protein